MKNSKERWVDRAGICEKEGIKAAWPESRKGINYGSRGLIDEDGPADSEFSEAKKGDDSGDHALENQLNEIKLKMTWNERAPQRGNSKLDLGDQLMEE